MKTFLRWLLVLFVLAIVAFAAYAVYYMYVELEEEKLDKQRINNQLKQKQKELKAQKKNAETQKISNARLKRDADKDGLSLAEEMKQNTSDNNADTDGDGIGDKFDLHPAGGGRKVYKNVSWNYRGDWNLDVSIPGDIITYYEKVDRPQWEGSYDYYTRFVDKNDKGIELLAQKLKVLIDANQQKPNWDYHDDVMLICRMVQNLRYANDVLIGFDDYTKYPMQTFMDGSGDCEDSAILTASLLHKLEYESMLVFLQLPNNTSHLGIAVWGSNGRKGQQWQVGEKTFYYLETTQPNWKLGQIPPEWEKAEFHLIKV